MLSMQPLQRLRSYLYGLLWRWLQHLAPAPPERAAPLATLHPGATAVASNTAVPSSTAVASSATDGQPHAAGSPSAIHITGPVEISKSGPPAETDGPGPGPGQGAKAGQSQQPARPGTTLPLPMPNVVPTGGSLRFADERAAFCPGQRQPLSVEEAVLARDMSLLKREAADALAALGAAHALVTSARLAQVQQLRPLVERGEVPGEALKALAADYQGWQNDQVRLFDALALVMRMQVPPGKVLDQVDRALQEQARQHLASLSVEYQRRQLQHQIKRRS